MLAMSIYRVSSLIWRPLFSLEIDGIYKEMREKKDIACWRSLDYRFPELTVGDVVSPSFLIVSPLRSSLRVPDPPCSSPSLP